MSSKTMHMSLSVRGALRWPKRRLNGLLRDTKSGRRLSATEVRDELLDLLSQGVGVIPIGACEGHDPKTGCPGHPVPTVDVSGPCVECGEVAKP